MSVADTRGHKRTRFDSVPGTFPGTESDCSAGKYLIADTSRRRRLRWLGCLDSLGTETDEPRSGPLRLPDHDDDRPLVDHVLTWAIHTATAVAVTLGAGVFRIRPRKGAVVVCHRLAAEATTDAHRLRCRVLFQPAGCRKFPESPLLDTSGHEG
jgi:hypothetical protein